MHHLFSLHLPDVGRTLAVQSFKGRERVSSCYRFRIIVEQEQIGETSPLSLLGKPVVLRILGPAEGPREVCGIVSDVHDHGHGALRLRLEPRLVLLGLHHASRIFQDMTVPEVITEVLSVAGVPCAWALSAGYPPRTYCVQYQESALAFVQRLCAEEGIFYFFTVGADTTEVVVFADDPSSYQPLSGEPALVYRPAQLGMRRGEQDVHRFELGRRLRPSRVLARSYDPLRPAFDAVGSATAASRVNGDVGDARAQSHYRHGRAPIVEQRQRGPHPHVSDMRAEVLLDQLRRGVWRAEGDSACPRLIPGARFALEGREELWTAGEGYVVTSVEHVGHPAEAGHDARYENRFAVVPASTAIRPAPAPRVLRQVAETALVVGGEHQEVHTDPLGRIKIQFYWDREGARNEHSSCWVRVAQAWAGEGWGAQFLPRVGMEVLVLFEAGDVDRPIVAGCLPNARTVPPFDPSRDASRSGWRTRNLGGNGSARSHELSFDDAKSREEILVRSEGDLRVIARRRHLVQCAEQNVVVSGRCTAHLGSAETRVDGHVVMAAERVERAIAGDAVDTIGGKLALGAGARAVRIENDDRQSTGGDALATITGCATTIVGTSKKPASWTTHATGAVSLTADGVLELAAKKGLVFRCGKSEPLRIGPGGIDVVGMAVRATDPDGAGGLAIGPKGVRLDAKGDVRVQAARVVAVTANASLDVCREVTLDGEQIRLNSPAAKEDAPEVHCLPTSVQLVDQHGKPVAGARFVVHVGDERRSGVLGKDGSARVQLEDGETATIAFSSHDVDGAHTLPLGSKTHVVRSGEHLARIAADLGLDAAAVWNHPKNADLRAQRKDMHILSENDVLWFEAVERGTLPLRAGAPNTFHARIRFTETHLRLAGPDGRPLAGEVFEAEGEGLELTKGTTDGEGKLTVRHPSAARSCVVRVVRLGVELPLGLGDVDPADAISGAQQRLAGLGHYDGPASGKLDDETATAVLAFQKAQGLDGSGEINPETTEALVRAYGC